MAARQSLPFAERDTQLLCIHEHEDEPHAQQRWRARAPPEFATMSVYTAWREAKPVDYPALELPRQYARYHRPSNMVLIGDTGCLETVVHLFDDAPAVAREAVLEQVGDTGGDGRGQ